MGQTVVQKIAQAHLAEGPKRPLRTGDFVSIRPHRVMTHDNTSAVMSKFKGIGAKKIHDPTQLVFALDHDIQNQDEVNQKKYRAIEAFAKEHGVDFWWAGFGLMTSRSLICEAGISGSSQLELRDSPSKTSRIGRRIRQWRMVMRCTRRGLCSISARSRHTYRVPIQCR